MTSSSDTRKKVYIVEDHPVFREGLVQILNLEKGLVVCGEAEDAEHAFQSIPTLQPDIVLVDLTLPGKSGLEMIKELRAAQCPVKILVVSMHDEALYANRVLRAGGNGYIMKQEDPEEIVHAILDVLGGRIYVSEQVMAGASPPDAARRTLLRTGPIGECTDLEIEILQLLGQGKTNAEVACLLNLGVRAVSARCTQLRRKLNLKSANELIRYAVCFVETGEGRKMVAEK